MTTKKTIKPAGDGKTPQRRFGKILQGTHDHYSLMLPNDTGGLTGLLLRLFYSGIKLDKEQTETIRQLDKNAIVVYVSKYKSYFEYLFYYSRYRRKNLPYPQIGFDYKVYLWQPLSRLLRIFLARLDFLIRHQSLPDPYARGILKQELINGRSGFLSLVGKKSF